LKQEAAADAIVWNQQNGNVDVTTGKQRKNINFCGAKPMDKESIHDFLSCYLNSSSRLF
jgi:hypothetical protein